MGCDPFNFADAMLGILAQRLVRRLDAPNARCSSRSDARPCRSSRSSTAPRRRSRRTRSLLNGASAIGNATYPARAPGCDVRQERATRDASDSRAARQLALVRPLIRRSAGADELRTQGLRRHAHAAARTASRNAWKADRHPRGARATAWRGPRAAAISPAAPGPARGASPFLRPTPAGGSPQRSSPVADQQQVRSARAWRAQRSFRRADRMSTCAVYGSFAASSTCFAAASASAPCSW
jgi:hypothetical protein